MTDLNALFKLQKENRWSVARTTAEERIFLLKKLKSEILKRREDIKLALYKDFKKPDSESELTEIHTVLDELNFALKNLKRWMKPKKVRTPIALFGSHSSITYEPKGVVLILSPWNYPFALFINPLIAAVAAGNCVIGRPSEKTTNTSLILKEIVEAVFKPDHVCLVQGEVDVAQKLLELPFDHIFFTGSTSVGKIVAKAAAEKLISVTLELGGKSPVIIDSDVNIAETVEKLSWGKFMNGGQTCVAPDYLFVPEEMKMDFTRAFVEHIKKQYGNTPEERFSNPDFARLIDQGSFNRLTTMIEKEKNLIEGVAVATDRYLPPAILHVTPESPVMKEEIFGPILPIMTYRNVEEALEFIQNREKPLALYVFSKNRSFIEKVLSNTTSGGAVINHVVIHLANPYLPFGGVGHSGLGSYHGHFGFKAFSHEKSVLSQGKFSLIKLYFPPYNRTVSKLAFKLLRFLE